MREIKLRKYRVKIETKMVFTREIEADNDLLAETIAESLADNLSQEDFSYDNAYNEIVELKII